MIELISREPNEEGGFTEISRDCVHQLVIKTNSQKEIVEIVYTNSGSGYRPIVAGVDFHVADKSRQGGQQ